MELKQNIESLIVTRDGHLDDEYYDAIYAERRRAALQTAGREVLHFAVQAPLTIGKGIVYLFTHELTDSLQVK